ncbi:hypothetical protein OEV98_08835 [Caldibacillus lycopersici]|uniref:Uncharacterized protein n=1 Tax=Perspicuibacillus lycopersici TaxID=1325689 RepID=A0AAE3IX50_9BACI|nr:hypothetical protein [Perspicuibacillus lycopersici]MCU9613665.1 hypothetical protein [Perspicuibacillus lycopersici]
MYRENLDFTMISKAIEFTYQQLQTENVNNEQAFYELQQAEENLQQALNYLLTNRVKH